MIEVEVSEETTNRLHAILEGMGLAEEKVLKPALSRGLSAGKTVFNKQIKSVYNITTAVISEHSKVGYNQVKRVDDGLIGEIEFAGTVIPLYKFRVSPKTPTYGKKKVNVSVKKGNTGVSRKGFIAKMQSEHLGVFHRINKYSSKQRNQINQTKYNQMIKERYGPSVPRMAENTVVIQSVEDRVSEVINKRINHEIERLINGYGG